MEGGRGHCFAPSFTPLLVSLQLIKPQGLLLLSKVKEGCLLAPFLQLDEYNIITFCNDCSDKNYVLLTKRLSPFFSLPNQPKLQEL